MDISRLFKKLKLALYSLTLISIVIDKCYSLILIGIHMAKAAGDFISVLESAKRVWRQNL